MKLISTWKYHNENPVRDIYVATEHKEYCICLRPYVESGYSGTLYNHLSDIATGMAKRITREDIAYIQD